jgi:hypothetical protein
VSVYRIVVVQTRRAERISRSPTTLTRDAGDVGSGPRLGDAGTAESPVEQAGTAGDTPVDT